MPRLRQGSGIVNRPTGTTKDPRAYDPDLGPVEVRPFPEKDRKRWAKAVNEGAWLAYPEDGADHYHEVFMCRLGGRYRFIARGALWYGPQLPHLCAAVYWAFGHGWLDPTNDFEFNVQCQVEVRRNTFGDIGPMAVPCR